MRGRMPYSDCRGSFFDRVCSAAIGWLKAPVEFRLDTLTGSIDIDGTNLGIESAIGKNPRYQVNATAVLSSTFTSVSNKDATPTPRDRKPTRRLAATLIGIVLVMGVVAAPRHGPC